jgi:hypothetical protein
MKARHWIPLALVALGVVGWGVLTLLNSYTSQQLEAAIVRIPKPDIIVAYERDQAAAQDIEGADQDAIDPVPVQRAMGKTRGPPSSAGPRCSRSWMNDCGRTIGGNRWVTNSGATRTEIPSPGQPRSGA